MRRILVLVAIAVAACGPTGARWVGENIHVVDGYWVDIETPCLPGAPGSDCKVEVEEAIKSLPAADREQVVGAALAGYPGSYIDASGQTILMTTGGLHQPHIVVLDLVDGRRRVVTLLCIGPITSGDGAIVEPKTCFVHDLPNLRADRAPAIGP
jgi:hypothetical protein